MCEASEANPFEIPTAPRQPFELSDDLALRGSLWRPQTSPRFLKRSHG